MSFDQETVRLPIRFGPKVLARLSFQALVCQDHFADLSVESIVPNGTAEAMIFPSVPLDGGKHRVLTFRNAHIFYSPKLFPHYLADLTGDFESYLNFFGSKSKATLRRKVRKFDEVAGPDSFREYRTPDELLEFHRGARELSKRTYQEKLLGHGLPEGSEFIQKMTELASQNQVRAYSLSLNGRFAAYLYCPARQGILYYDFLGYDPEHSAISPGAVLQYRAFERLYAEKQFRLFDFEEGEGQHKRQFSTTCIQCSNLMIFRRGPKSIAYIAADYSFQRLTELSLRLLDKLNLRTRARKAIR